VSQQRSLDHDGGPNLARGYTLALGIVATLFLLGALTTYSMAENPEIDPSVQWAFIFTTRLNVAVAAITGLVVYLRVRKSQFAIGATGALSILLAFYFPVGTAVFLYWWFGIRRRERAAA